VSKQRTEAALEEVNEYLSSQDPASGLIVAFERAIAVSLFLTMGYLISIGSN